MALRKKVTEEVINTFINGYDPEEHIVNLDYNYQDDFVTVITRDNNDKRQKRKHPFYPFCWATLNACKRLCFGKRDEVKSLLSKYGIQCIALDYHNEKGEVVESVKNGYAYMFKAIKPLSYQNFLQFFKEAKNPISRNTGDASRDRQYLTCTPQEQFLISTGKRFFKGYDDYNQLLRAIFDLETEGLDPLRHRIISVGIRFNRPVTYKGVTKEFQRIVELEGKTDEEKNKSEYGMICFFLKCIALLEPDVVGGHNTENFDWNFIMKRCEVLGIDFKALTERFFGIGNAIYKRKKETVLKLGGEVEHFFQTVVPNTTVVDSLHAVRRAQATDSNFKEANLKYATRYLHLVKENRVYVPGNKISEISDDYEEHYAFNDKNGHWYIYDPSTNNTSELKVEVGKEFKLTRRPTIEDGYTLVSGHYIVQRYLYDDIYEGDKVEYTLNLPDFLICKMVPTVFQKAITMGTAGQWKLIMMAWSYENGLAIPKPKDTGKFTGGLSRLLRTGAILSSKANEKKHQLIDYQIVKLDFNSLYPSIILTWHIGDVTDLMNAMLYMLEYVLTTRELHKGLKKNAGKIKDAFEDRMAKGEILSDTEKKEYEDSCNTYKVEDNNQLTVKKLGNSFFGSYGSGNGSVFPWKSLVCAERTTCTGRQSLRLMISHFSTISTFRSYETDGIIKTDHQGKDLGDEYNYLPIVGDSFTEDTPLFIKYNETGEIDIKPICDLINEESINVDVLGREYDYSKKPYKVLCRSGWVEPSYIYRHKTDKDIYEVSDGDMRIEVTEDHSLFNENKEKIKPSEINKETKLEYYVLPIHGTCPNDDGIELNPIEYAKKLANGEIDRVPKYFLNNKNKGKEFYRYFMKYNKSNVEYSKTCLAGLLFCKNICIS